MSIESRGAVPLRRDPGSPPAPIRHVHLGLGNFFRAHQAWYTQHSPDAGEWGIAAFTGRRAELARTLAGQDGLYHLDVRSADGDGLEVVTTLSAAHAAEDHEAWLRLLADPAVALVTSTVTEAGYQLADGRLDLDRPAVRGDLETLRTDPRALVRTAPGRLVAGLAARRRADAGPLALVPCDNLAENGTTVHRAVRDLAELLDPALAAWVDDQVHPVTTMVDRITPETTDADVALVRRLTGTADAAPVVTEPFSEWVLAGRFPGGRPRWEDAGATLVEDVAPFAARKLWLLNGAHSLLAYAGLARGHATVAEAVADPLCREWVEEWWDEAAAQVPLPRADLEAYRAALVTRFENPAIRHRLEQIAADGSLKLPVRILPTLRTERARGRLGAGASRVLAAWIVHLRDQGAVNDVASARVLGAAAGPVADAVPRVLDLLDPSVAADDTVVAAVLAQVEEVGR